jgi:integrase
MNGDGGPKHWDEKYRARARAGKITHRELEGWISKAKPGSSLPFGGNLQLEISTAGTALWRTYYRIRRPEDGKLIERTFSHGPFSSARGYGDVGKEHERVKEQARKGMDPVKARYVAKANQVAAGEDTFEAVAREWLGDRTHWSAVHRQKSVRALERDVFPYIGRLPVGEITPAMVSKVIERITKRGVGDTPAKILQHVTRVFRLAQTRGLKDNPAIPAREKLPQRVNWKRYPALLKWPELGEILRTAEAARLTAAVHLAHRLCAFTVARIGNVVSAEWPEFHLEADTPRWVIPRAKMKAQDREHDHKIILGPTIAAELRAWKKEIGGRGFVFPSPAGGEHITRESLEKVYRVTLGLEGKHTPHGWRSSLSTLARDEGGFDRDVVELTLDHIHDNDVVRAYDRGERLEQRIKLMNWWDAQLARAQKGAEILSLPTKRA